MANSIPCPNPVCTHEFSAADLQASAQLLCPKCGFRMQGRGPAAAPAPKPAAGKPASGGKSPPTKPLIAAPVGLPPKPPAPPPSAPVAAPPLATPVVASVPPAVAPPAAPPAGGESSVADGAFFNPGAAPAAGTLVRTGGPVKRPFNWVRALILVLSVGFAACIVIVAGGLIMLGFGFGGFKLGGGGENVAGNIYYGQIRAAKDGHEKIYKLALLREEWEIDREAASRFEAHAAWKHREYEFWFALVVQDYGMLKPRDAEMLRIGIEKLETFYGDALEIDKYAEPAKIKDLPAQKIRFKGQIKQANWVGECYMFFNNGIAYWLYIASPDWNTVVHFADELPKKNVFVESERKGWREQPPPMETYASSNGRITAKVPKSVWEKTPNAKDLDEKGELFLFGKYQKAKDNRKNASMLVFALDKQPDAKEAMKKAREYLDSKIMNEDKNFKILRADAEGQGEDGATEDIGNRKGRLIDLKQLFNDEPKRYYLLAVVNEPDTTYGILCECTWESRQIWRQDFIDVLRSLNFKKGD